jgi:tRNA(Ile)-lysidine synthase
MTLALLSGGRDSVCLVHTLLPDVEALHVNYGLRPEADADEAFCEVLCDRLGVPLHVHRAGPPEGNVQDWARRVRYAAAHALTDGDIATGHTATDQVETVLYRLAASPGRRALLGMRERQGRIVRPLLRMTREDTTAYCTEHGLDWREDASNADPAYARNRTRANLVPALRQLHPAAEANVLATVDILRAEADVLDGLVADVIRGRDALPAAELAALDPALRRLVFIALAGAPVGHRVDEVLALGHGAVDVGYGRRATVAQGVIRVDSLP